MTVHVLQLFAELGIPPNYGVDPPLPTHAETELLVDVEPNIVGRMQRLHPDTARAWRTMKAAAQQDGITLLLVSGFRSFGYQIELIRAKLEEGQDIASILSVNTAPGFSEHHTGRAVDLATPGTRPLTDQFESSDAFFWRQHNAQQFGFHMPYGRGNRYGLSYEPWHWSQLGGADRAYSTPATV
jgi:D-alanyl-D-alanine carboxypeptidase